MGIIKKFFENSNSTLKKIIIPTIIVSVLIGIILLIYCGLYKNQKNEKETLPNESSLELNFENTNISTKTESQWKTENVKITVKEDSITRTGALIEIEDKNETPKSWEVSFAIQKLGDDNKWVDLITKENITWIEIAMSPNENGITQMQVDWSKIYGELNPGTYRIVKNNGTATLYSESFTITKQEKGQEDKIDMIKLKVNNRELEVKLEENEATKKLVEKLKNGDITVKANEYGGFEKVGNLGFSLPKKDTYITTSAGDIVLYQGNQISLFYNSNSWNYTRLGKIQNVSESELKNILGKEDVDIILSLN